MNTSIVFGFIAGAALLYATMAFNQADGFAVAMAVLVAFVATILGVAFYNREGGSSEYSE